MPLVRVSTRGASAASPGQQTPCLVKQDRAGGFCRAGGQPRAGWAEGSGETVWHYGVRCHETAMLEAREVICTLTPGSSAGVQDANMGRIWGGGLNESLQAATVVSLPGKGSQARQSGDLCYGPTVFAHPVCRDIIVSAYDTFPSSCHLDIPPPQGRKEGWSWAARAWG